MSEKTVEIDTANGKHDAPCYYAKGGLAVTRRHMRYGWMDDWAITHVASGQALNMWGGTKTAAKRRLLAVLPLTDWTKSGKAIKRVAGLKSKVNEITYGPEPR
jgi:hypothetical protein